MMICVPQANLKGEFLFLVHKQQGIVGAYLHSIYFNIGLVYLNNIYRYLNLLWWHVQNDDRRAFTFLRKIANWNQGSGHQKNSPRERRDASDFSNVKKNFSYLGWNFFLLFKDFRADSDFRNLTRFYPIQRFSRLLKMFTMRLGADFTLKEL